MPNGPPTPPPTSKSELQDEARTPSITPSSAGLASTRLDSYQQIFPVIANLAAQSNFLEIIRVAERTEITSDNNLQVSRLFVTAPLVLAYLIVDDLPPARHALLRIGEGLGSAPLSKFLGGLVASTWERKYSNVYLRADSLYQLLVQADFFSSDLAKVLTQMLTVFIEAFQRRTFTLLSNAFATLPLQLAQTYLNMQPEPLIAAAHKEQWAYDPSTEIFVPKPTPAPINNNHLSSTLSTFQYVASSVARLEL